MNAKGYSRIPSELGHWTTFLGKALPPQDLLELLLIY